MSAQLEADAEERAMEAEALEAIFMESYSGTEPRTAWSWSPR